MNVNLKADYFAVDVLLLLLMLLLLLLLMLLLWPCLSLLITFHQVGVNRCSSEAPKG